MSDEKRFTAAPAAVAPDSRAGVGRYTNADEWEDGWEGSWDGHAWQGQGYYDEYGSYAANEAGGEWGAFEVELYTMVFSLDDALQPQELYKGLEFDEKSLVITLEVGDVDEQSPAAWRSRPLKIHPEPFSASQKAEKKNPPLIATTNKQAPGRQEPETIAAHQQTGSPTGANGIVSAGATPTLPASQETAAATPAKLDKVPPPGAGTDEPFTLSPAQAPEVPASAGAGAIASQNGAPPAVQNHKIVISNIQLEDLKQKMQVLKQKKGFPLAALPIEEDNLKPNKTVDTPSEVLQLRCPKSHILTYFLTPDAGWWCSVCNSEHSAPGIPFYGCRACDYDECERCAKLSPEDRKVLISTVAERLAKSAAALRSPKKTTRSKRVEVAASGNDSETPLRKKDRKRERGDRTGRDGHRRKTARRKNDSSPQKSNTTRSGAASTRTRAAHRSDDDEEASDDQLDEAEDTAVASTGNPGSNRSTMLRNRRGGGGGSGVGTPERWEPKDRRGAHVHGRRRGRHESADESSGDDEAARSDAPGKRRAAFPVDRTVSNRSVSPDGDSSSSKGEPPPKKHNLDPVDRRKALSEHDDCGNAPVSLMRAAMKRSPDGLIGGAKLRGAPAKVGSAVDMPRSRLLPTGDRGASGMSEGGSPRAGARLEGESLLRKVLRANNTRDQVGANAERASVRECVDMGQGVATRGSLKSLKASNRDRPAGMRKAFEDVTSHLDTKSRRV